MHCGALFQASEGELFLLHLAWNYDLRRDRPDQSYSWVKIGLAPSDRKLMAIVADRVWKARPKVPYGLSRHDLSFDPQTGALSPGLEGPGFTCASFLLALLHAQGYQLLAEEEWHLGVNPEWDAFVIEALKISGATESQIEAVNKDAGSRRFKPSEVVASSSIAEYEWPVAYDKASVMGEDLEAILA